MKNRRFVVGLLFAALILTLAACEPKGPIAQVDSPRFDFGSVEQNSQATNTFVLKNVGDQELIIKRTRSTCGCTVAKPSKEQIAPGETSEIKVTFSTGRRSGRQEKHIMVYTNDPQNEKIELVLTGEVVQVVAFDPDRLRFDEMKPDVAATKTFIAKNVGNKPVTIDKIAVNETDFLAVKSTKDLPITLAAGESLPVEVTLKLPADRKFFHGRIELTPAGKAASMVYYVAGRLEGAVTRVRQMGDTKGNVFVPGEVANRIYKVKKKADDEKK